MPDLIAHLAAGYVASDLGGFDKGAFLLGSVLPDIKIASYIFAPLLDDQTGHALFYVFDAPITFIPLALIVSVFFHSRRKIFLHSSLAILLHLGLDSLQYKFGGGILPLYPPLAQRFSFGLVWQDDYRLTLIAVGALALLVLFRRFRAKSKG